MKNTTDQIWFFGIDGADGNIDQKELLGGKGANLAEMADKDFPVPPGFTIPTTVCNAYRKMDSDNNRALFMASLYDDFILPAMLDLEDHMEGKMPLVSVRSGAQVSMPGMMDTILNVGITEDNLDYWKQELGSRTALDCYRRLLQMYGTTVCGVPSSRFEGQIEFVKRYKYGLEKEPVHDSEMVEQHFEKLIPWFKNVMEEESPECFPENNIRDQMMGAVEAVFKSWDNPRAKTYRAMKGYSEEWGTAVNIQSMVFGNLNEQSCSGVLFTRNPDTGDNQFLGEFLVNAQGEDVVAGIRTPEPVQDMEEWCPTLWANLKQYAERLEFLHKDMQDIEFTVEDGVLYLLQTRNANRSSEAAFRVAVEMSQEGLITQAEAMARVSAKQYVALNKPRIDPSFDTPPDGKGLPAGGGVITGTACLTSDEAVACAGKAILVRFETTPDDIEGMNHSVGILTAMGGVTSHAAVVARGLDKTCVVGCTDMMAQNEDKLWKLGDNYIQTGTKLTIDGSTGNVWVDVEVPLLTTEDNQYAEEVIKWATAAGGEYVERVMADMEMDFDDSPAAIYLDTVAIEDDMKAFAEALRVIELNTAIQTVHLDLRTKYDWMEDDDKDLWSVFETASDMAVVLENKMDVLSQLGWNDLKSRVILHLPPNAPKHRTAELANSDWTISQTVDSMDDLLSAEGMINIGAAFESSVGGLDNMNKLMDIFEAAGQKIGKPPKAVSKSRRLFDILG